MRVILNPGARLYIYTVMASILTAATVWGFIDNNQLGALTGVAAAVCGMAALNVPIRNEQDHSTPAMAPRHASEGEEHE